MGQAVLRCSPGQPGRSPSDHPTRGFGRSRRGRSRPRHRDRVADWITRSPDLSTVQPGRDRRRRRQPEARPRSSEWIDEDHAAVVGAADSIGRVPRSRACSSSDGRRGRSTGGNGCSAPLVVMPTSVRRRTGSVPPPGRRSADHRHTPHRADRRDTQRTQYTGWTTPRDQQRRQSAQRRSAGQAYDGRGINCSARPRTQNPSSKLPSQEGLDHSGRGATRPEAPWRSWSVLPTGPESGRRARR